MAALFIIEIVICSLVILACLLIIGMGYVVLKKKKAKRYDADFENVSDEDLNQLVTGIKFCMVVTLVFGFLLAVAICALILL